MELQKDFGLVDSTEGEEDEELEQEKIAHQVEGGISLRHYQVMLIIFFILGHLKSNTCYRQNLLEGAMSWCQLFGCCWQLQFDVK